MHQASSLESNWPLLIPPLLALLDDASTAYKIRGCSLLTSFLRTVSPRLLERTGLGEVFQEALTPCLLYLPELTPELESLRLLRIIYPTLLILVRTRFPEERDQECKQKALDHIFRCGILKGFALAGENVRIAECLIRRMSDIVEEMGIASCQHLKVCIYYLFHHGAPSFAGVSGSGRRLSRCPSRYYRRLLKWYSSVNASTAYPSSSVRNIYKPFRNGLPAIATCGIARHPFGDYSLLASNSTSQSRDYKRLGVLLVQNSRR